MQSWQESDKLKYGSVSIMKKFFILTVVNVVCLLLSLSISSAQEPYQLYAPPTPSSIPLLLAARNIEELDVTIFSNHSQAHTLFLRGDVQVLSTGLSVGLNFFQQDIPVQVINSYVSGLSYLVTRGNAVTDFQELKGRTIYLPFEGSPLEEITRFFVEQEGLDWKEDFEVIYSPFQASLELLKRGEADAVVLPQPLATIAATPDGVFLSFSYKDKWEQSTGLSAGYPQVGTFVKRDWAAEHSELLGRLNDEIEQALTLIENDPAQTVALTKDAFKFPEKILLASLKQIDFSLGRDESLKEAILKYYSLLGQPLDETFDAFFYLDPH